MEIEITFAVLFTILAVIALRFWARTRDLKSFYIALIFVPLGLVELWSLGTKLAGVTAGSDATGFQFGTRLMFAMIIMYPWALYQFSCTVRRKQSKLGAGLAIALSLPLIVFVLFYPWPANQQDAGFKLILSMFMFGLLIQFLALSVTAAVKLWLAGQDQPDVVRMRLRCMSAAALLLSAALALGTTSGSENTRAVWVQAAYLTTSVLSTVLFMLCLAPPRILRVHWSYSAIRAVREVIRNIIVAESRSDAVALALPIMCQVVGSQYAIGYDSDGQVLATHPTVPESEQLDEIAHEHTIVIPMESEGQVVLYSNTLWPFVGQEETDLLKFVGSSVGLALNRRRLDEANAQLRVQSAVELSLRIQAQELERANRELNEFVAIASHDLQTPVRNIIDNVEFLDEDLEGQRSLSSEARQDLQFIRDGAHRIKTLIDGLLHYTEVDAGKTNENSAVALNSVFDQVAISMASVIEETNATISVDALPPVLGVYSELGEVFVNIFDNAIKYRSPDRNPYIKVSASLESQDMVDIFITDNGIGIAPQFREHVFDMFKRLHAHDEIPGTGIGLAVCRKMIERMGGTIAFVEPQDSVGARIHITLPTTEHGYIARVA